MAQVRIVPGNPEDGVTPVLVSVVPSAGTARTPVDICCVVDISGSMGNEAVLKNGDNETANSILTVLAVVKHATRTIMHNLGAEDRLALVTYSNNAEIVFGLTPCDAGGRRTMEGKIDALTAYGMTNLWDGLKVGLETLKAGEGPGRLQHIMLFTDGLPNINPPRGILPMLKRMKDKEGGRLPVTVNTFGFGNELDSELLSQLASECSGAYAFIPDAGFVGTVFVNAMANLLVTMVKDVVLEVQPQNGARVSEVLGVGPMATTSPDGKIRINLGTMQFGQSKDVVLNMQSTSANCLRATVEFKTPARTTESASCDSCGPADAIVVERQRLRSLAVDSIRNALNSTRLNAADKAAGKMEQALKNAQSHITAAVTKMRASPISLDEEVAALMEDLEGQAMEALSREDWFTKWGCHYLPSLMFAHLMEQCNNFKDAGVQAYGGQLFENVRDAADDIFLSLPPPVPVPRPSAPSTSAPVTGYTAGSTMPSAPPSQPAATISMAAFHDRYAGCIDGTCRVSLADGSERPIAELRKGDVVSGALGRPDAEVICVVRTSAPEGHMPLVQLAGCGPRLTPYHPVRVNGHWQFPVDIAPVQNMPCDAVYTVVLDEGACALVIDGVACVTWGHGIEEGVAKHPYFGDRKRVLEDLSHLAGFGTGLVELFPGCVQRDEVTGLVNGLTS
eukprot:TRINITY_DN64255_c0_g1_i1.p1 TRINITY_DN64255_c0_g1~~TRINITY_DN64255_c0_g1_i1.p1  ORF type:complete len:677 (+),score=76.31 TRINITY_DN64255_c0_g1_i1:91-2121(+)